MLKSENAIRKRIILYWRRRALQQRGWLYSIAKTLEEVGIQNGFFDGGFELMEFSGMVRTGTAQSKVQSSERLNNMISCKSLRGVENKHTGGQCECGHNRETCSLRSCKYRNQVRGVGQD